MKNPAVALFLLFLFSSFQELAIAAMITFTNNCSYTVWPGTLATGNQMPQLSTTGFELPIGASKSVNIASPWSGQIWGRTGCSNDSGIFVCVTGDCGSGLVECNGAGASPPTTLVELATASKGGQELYHVSNVNGFNLPMSIAPKGGSGNCHSSSCSANITSDCLEELQVRWSDGSVIACKSACLAFNEPMYCCTGHFNTTDRCRSTKYSNFFEERCPEAYNYAYDNIRLNGSFSCSGRPSYNITFCPYHTETALPWLHTTFDITNRCNHTIWAAAMPGGGGRELNSGESWAINMTAGTTGGRIWARTGCSFDGSGRGQCQTGDCGGVLQCTQYGTPPNTLAEFALNQSNHLDFDISLVDGFNVPIGFSPTSNGCSRGVRCTADINGWCPNVLKAPGGCNNPCTVFKTNWYCCNSGSCGPTDYSEFFKNKCPDAYSYPKDDRTSTVTCLGGTHYRVEFCPLSHA